MHPLQWQNNLRLSCKLSFLSLQFGFILIDTCLEILFLSYQNFVFKYILCHFTATALISYCQDQSYARKTCFMFNLFQMMSMPLPCLKTMALTLLHSGQI